MSALSIRKPTIVDLLKLARWLSKPHVKTYWESPRGFLGRFRKYYRYLHSERITQFMIVQDGSTIGYVQCARSNDDSGHWELDILIGDEQCIGKGIGPKVLALCEHHLIEKYEAQSIFVDPLANNERAIRAFTKANFVYHSTRSSPQGTIIIMRKSLKENPH